MSNNSGNAYVKTFTLPWLAIFVAIKLAGTSLAAWSWWWLLFPLVPVLALGVKHLGL